MGPAQGTRGGTGKGAGTAQHQIPTLSVPPRRANQGVPDWTCVGHCCREGPGRSSRKGKEERQEVRTKDVWLSGARRSRSCREVGAREGRAAGTRLGPAGRRKVHGRDKLPLQSPPPSPRPRPPRMLSDWPSLYMKAVSSSVWPRSRKARTAAALAGASIRRPISMVPSTVAGRTGGPEAARGGDSGRDMAVAARASGTRGPRVQRTAPRATARRKALSMRSAPAR